MKNIERIFRIETAFSLLLGLIFFAAASVATVSANDAARSEPKTEALIARDLSQKLKTDLSENNLSVKFRNLEEEKLSANVVEVKGDAFCVLPAEQTELPLKFEAKYDLLKQTVTDVQYVFVETAESAYAPSSSEEILMKTLMTRIGADYKTDQITIAIDGFDAAPAADGKISYKGAGEVKIGQFVWNRVDFDVTLNEDQSAAQINYKIRK